MMIGNHFCAGNLAITLLEFHRNHPEYAITRTTANVEVSLIRGHLKKLLVYFILPHHETNQHTTNTNTHTNNKKQISN